MKESMEKTGLLARKEMHAIAQRRVSEIAKEFTEGFEFLSRYKKSVTIFGAHQLKEDHPYYQSARALAFRLAKELDYTIISGGGPGIMEAANRGAYEAGGNSLGFLINLIENEGRNKYLTESYSFDHFFVRKVCLSFSAEAFIFYPGGLGTLDEFFEILTLINTKKVTDIPLICVGSDYWNALKDFMKKEILARGTVEAESLEIFRITDDHDEVIKIIEETCPHGKAVC